jgi:hypothetical protein
MIRSISVCIWLIINNINYSKVEYWFTLGIKSPVGISEMAVALQQGIIVIQN